VKTPEPTKPAVSATVKPATTPASTAPNGATATALGSTSKPAAGGRALYGIAVGSYLFEDRAKSELATMSDKTHLPSRVIAVSDGGTSMFQVVVGSFTSRAAAETQANALVRTGQANQASVISLPRATPANP